MADVKMDWDLEEVMIKIEHMGKDVNKFEKDSTLAAAKVVKSAVEKNLPRSDINKAGYTHMQDDVKISSLKTDKELNKVREVKGGKKTYYKWKFLEYGTSKMKGNQFLTKSIKESKDEAIKIINNAIKKALDL